MTDTTEKKRGRGRPRKYADNDSAARVRDYRKRMNKETTRYDIYIGISASNKITRLAKQWDYTISQAIEKLILEADLKYKDILCPDDLPDHIIEDIIHEKIDEMLNRKRKQPVVTGNNKS